MSTDASTQPGMLCVSIHDVAPATWSDCQRLVQAVRAVADIPLTFLVVPHYHFRPEQSPAMEAGLDAAVARGDELALHGYSHLDTEASGGGLASRFLRNVYTRREGEFAALAEAEARRRIELGLDWFDERGWTPSGFVPPAWLLGKGAWRALRGSPFTYTTTFSHFHCLPEAQDPWQRTAPPDDAARRARRDRRSSQAGAVRGGDRAADGRQRQDGAALDWGRQGDSDPAGVSGQWAPTGSMGLQVPVSTQGRHDGATESWHGAQGERPEWLGRSSRTKEAERHEQREQRRRSAEQSRQSHISGQAGQHEQRDQRQRRDQRAQGVYGGVGGAGGYDGRVSYEGQGGQGEPGNVPGGMHGAHGAGAAARAEASAAGGIITRPGKAILSPSLVYAARNRGGRILSPRVADATAAMLAQSPLIRFSLHPPDVRYPELVRHIQQVLARLLERREAVTKAECARRLTRVDAVTTADPTSRSAASNPDPSHNSQATMQSAADRASY